MRRINHSPIYCEECANLALAVLDGAPLCVKCLQKSVVNGKPELLEQITPLYGRVLIDADLSRLSGSAPPSSVLL